MIIHDDDGPPTETAIYFEQSLNSQDSALDGPDDEKEIINRRRRLTPATGDGLNIKVKKNNTNSQSSTFDIEDNVKGICKEDLEELRTVYKQCKNVMMKMEQRYGHLLDIDAEDSLEKQDIKSSYENECQCSMNKKIVFDEDGKEISIEALPSNHICPTKLMVKNTHSTITSSPNIQIEYHDIELSNDIQELRHILQDPKIETTYRNKVIDKLKIIKQEHINEVRFNKMALIEKLKIDPEEVLSFNGANLSVLPGYSIF